MYFRVLFWDFVLIIRRSWQELALISMLMPRSVHALEAGMGTRIDLLRLSPRHVLGQLLDVL